MTPRDATETFAVPPRIGLLPGWHLGASADEAEAAARRERWEAVRSSVGVPWVEGLRVMLYPEDETSAALFCTGTYEPNEFVWLEGFLCPGMTVIDVGAHLGLYAMYAARRVAPGGRVVALEPSSREFARAQRHLWLNGLTAVTLRRMAACAEPGEVELLIAKEPHSGHNSLAGFAYDGVALHSREAVPAETLDRLVDREELDRVDLVKLDIEGGELAALRGAVGVLRDHRPALLFEVGDRHLELHGARRDDLTAFLQDLGYELHGFSERTGRLVPLERPEARGSNNLVGLHRMTGRRVYRRRSPPGTTGRVPALARLAGAVAARPRLSVVATSRNDDHGGRLLDRMQIFVNGFLGQCVRHDLLAELVLVEWNPPADRPPLEDALTWPADFGPAVVRIIRVPAAVHATLQHAEQLPVFQMLGKNVGIRRARGEFVLATNIDLLFSDALVRHLARGDLRAGRLYRTDRYDVDDGVPVGAPVADQLAYCERRVLRINRKAATLDVRTGERYRVYGPRLRRTLRALARGDRTALAQLWEFPRLHTNACGDFTLLAREDWFRLRGYAEAEIFSWHLDSLFCFAAWYSGIRETVLNGSMRTYHVEHGTGSGWTPEGQEALFARLDAAGIPYLTFETFWERVRALRDTPQPAALNGPEWGLAGTRLPEVTLAGAAAARRSA